MFLLRKWEWVNLFLEQYVSGACKDSRVYKIIKSFLGGLKVSLKYSFPAKIVWLNWDCLAVSFENSGFLRRLLSIRNGSLSGLKQWRRSSVLEEISKAVKGQLYFSLFKNGAMIIIIAILTEAGLSLIFKKPIGLFGWLSRGLFLFAGLWGLNVSAGREEARKSSLFLKNYK